MKIKHFYFTTILLTAVLISFSFAQDNTQVGLPEGAIARLGKGGINIMRFSPDGTHLAVGTDVGVWLYDVPDGKETALFTGHAGQVNALAFSSDGKHLASGGSNDPFIHVWDVATKSKLSTLTLTQRRNELSALTFYGRMLIGINRSRKISYLNIDADRELSEKSFVVPSYNVIFSEDGSRLAAANRRGKIQLWNTTTNSQYATFMGHGDGRDKNILTLALSQDKKILASGSEDKTVKLWDTQNHTELVTLKGHDAWVTAIAFSDDGNIFASGDARKAIKIWDLESQKERATLTGHKNTINALTFAPEGTPRYSGCLASGSADGTIRFWNPENGEQLDIFTTGHTEWVKKIAFSENGKTIASVAFNGTLDLWSLKTRQERITLTDEHINIAETVVLSPNAMYFACRGSEGMSYFNPGGFGFQSSREGVDSNNLQFWDIATGEKLSIPWLEDNNRTSVFAISPYNNILVVGDDRVIRALHLKTGIELFQLKIEKPEFSKRLVFSPDGKKLAAFSHSNSPNVWDITTQRDISPPNIENVRVSLFSHDSSTLAMIRKNGIYLWNLDIELADKPNNITYLPGKLDGFRDSVILSPDGTILVGPGSDMWSYPIQLWDVEKGRRLENLSGHTEPIETLKFSQDGKILASGSQDGTVLLWDWEKISDKKK